MARNNSCAGALVAAGAASTSRPKFTNNSPAQSSPAAIQPHLKQCNRVPQKSASLRTSPRSLTPSQPGLSNRPFSSSPSEAGLGQPQTILRSTSSRSREAATRHLTAALIRHHLGQADPLAVRKVGKLYRHHRNPERALGLFLLRRLLWRTSRRPTTTMEFIEQIRRLQADESSSDEESGAVLTASTARKGQGRSSVVKAAKIAVTNQHAAKPGAPVGKERRNSVTNGAATENETVVKVEGTGAVKEAKGTETVGKVKGIDTTKKAKGTEAAEKAKGTEIAEEGTGSGAVGDGQPQKNAQVTPAAVNVNAEPSSKVNGTSQPNGTVHSKKRPLDDEPPTATSVKQQQHLPKRPKSEAESSKAAARTAVPPPPALLSTSPASPPKKHKKPLRDMEFFERRVHDMLTDPLGFDDCVAPTTRPIPRDMARSFASYRRKQKPPPPLVMSGALGGGGGGAAGGSGVGAGKDKSGKGKGKGGLSREARVRAHEKGLEQRVRAGGERGAVVMRGAVNGQVNGSSNGLADRSRPDGGKGKGNDLRPSSLGAGKRGGRQHSGGQSLKRSREMR